MKKKIVIKLLLIMVISGIFFSAKLTADATNLSQVIFSDNAFTYTISQPATSGEDGEVSIKANRNADNIWDIIKIQETVRFHGLTYEVTNITGSAFINQVSLTKVIIPQSITKIGTSAFYGCKNLTSVIIPDSVKTIQNNAFKNCSSQLVIYCSAKSAAYYYAKKNDISYKTVTFTKKGIINNDNKLILVGDSRTNNMSKWVTTSVPTKFVAKSGQGYLWFTNEAVDKVNSIATCGDIIVVWLGVNDYILDSLGGDTWSVYANKLNSLANNEWSDYTVCVASVGYIDRLKCILYYGKDIRSNVTQIEFGNQIHGIKEFNDNLKAALNNNITWIDTYDVIGIHENDYEVTPDNIWYTRSNGKKDGLHYSESKTQEIYDYFVKMLMPN